MMIVLNKLFYQKRIQYSHKNFSKLKNHILPLFLYSISSVWASWPLIKFFNIKVIGDGVDSLQHLWVLWHLKEWLLGNTNLFFTKQLFYPDGISLLTHGMGPITGFFALPFWLLGPEAAYNGAALLGICLTGYCAYLLARSLHLNWFSSICVGLILLLAPIHLAGLLGHIEKTFLGFLPLAIISLRNSLDKQRSYLWIFVTAIMVILSLLHSGYQFIYTVIAITFFTGISMLEVVSTKDGKLFSRIIYLFVAILVPVIPFVIAIVHSSKGIPVDVHLESQLFTPDVLQLFLPSIYNSVVGSRVEALLFEISPDTIVGLETNINLFIIGIILCVIALWKVMKQSKWWAIFTAICILLVLGPSLKVFGITKFTSYKLPIIMPYAFLTDLPGLNFMRAPGRLMLAAYVGFSVTAGFGIDWLMSNSSKNIKPFLMILVTVLILVEGWSKPWPVFDLPQTPEFYKVLAYDGDYYGVFDFPVKYGGESSIYMIYQMTHRKGIVQGVVSRTPPRNPYFIDLIAPDLPPDIHVDGKINNMIDYEYLLSHYGYHFIVWHNDLMGEDPINDFFRWVSVEKKPVFIDNQTTVFEILPKISNLNDESRVTAFHGKGWYDYDWNVKNRWAQSPAEINIFSNVTQPVSIVLKPVAIFDPASDNGIGSIGSMYISVNDELPRELEVEAGMKTNACIFLQQGWNQLFISADSGNFEPRDFQPGNNDYRLFSFAISDINIITSSISECQNEQVMIKN